MARTTSLKREFTVDEITPNPWRGRADERVCADEFIRIARSLSEREVIGRFSTFLEHVKPSSTGERVTRYNALFHWRVPAGREIEAGKEIGRHHILTHAYWREGGPEFANVNVMAVAHGTDKQLVLEHKAAIDKHLDEAGIPVSYTNVFWGGRSEIKPSEISPVEYQGVGKPPAVDRMNEGKVFLALGPGDPGLITEGEGNHRPPTQSSTTRWQSALLPPGARATGGRNSITSVSAAERKTRSAR